MIPKSFIDFYGDQTRWFIGEVVNVKDDPEKLGRVKVKIRGIHDGPFIETKDLPWAQVISPVTTAIHKGKGQSLGMLVGTQVFGIFLDGPHSQLPMVIGSIPKEGDANTKTKDNYPYNKVYETERGHYKEYDDTEGKERIKEYHTSGTYYEIKEDGSRKNYVVGKETLHVKNDIEIIGDENATVTITGNCNIVVTGDASISAKNVTVRASDKLSLSGTVVKINS